MRTRTTGLAIVVVLLASLAGCSSDDPDPAPTATVTATAAPSATPSLSKQEIAQQCADAVAERAKESTGEVQMDPPPAPCESLSDSEYLEAYYDALSKLNQR